MIRASILLGVLCPRVVLRSSSLRRRAVVVLVRWEEWEMLNLVDTSSGNLAAESFCLRVSSSLSGTEIV